MRRLPSGNVDYNDRFYLSGKTLFSSWKGKYLHKSSRKDVSIQI